MQETSAREVDVEAANAEAVRRMTSADPVLVDVQPALAVVPGMRLNLVLTSGPPLAFEEYSGPQRDAIVHAAVHEGLAGDAAEAAELLRRGDVAAEPTQHYGCGGSSTGVHTASTPVFVVEDRASGTRAFCGLYEGFARRLLSFGVYDDEVAARLRRVERVYGPVLGEAVRAAGGVPLKPIMARALRMGDELHSRTLAATTLLLRELALPLHDLGSSEDVRATLRYLVETEPLFLRLAIAAAKCMADAAQGVHGSSLVTAMTLNCRAAGIRVSGLGEREWMLGPLPEARGRFFDGYTSADAVWTGGESSMAETVGLGGFAQACAFTLQEYNGGDSAGMISANRAMYEITVAEHPDFVIPFFAFRGTPVGIDVFRVVATGKTPVIDAGYAAPGVGQIGAGTFRFPIDCFHRAAEVYARRYTPWHEGAR